MFVGEDGRSALVLSKARGPGGQALYDLDGGKPWTLIVGVPLLLGGLAAGTDRLRRRPMKGHGR